MYIRVWDEMSCYIFRCMLVCVCVGGGGVSIECNIECTFNEINTQDTISGI